MKYTFFVNPSILGLHCSVNNDCLYCIYYAVVFAPSAKGLQQLLDICSKFAVSHPVVFNVAKSRCLIVKSKNELLSRPSFQLCAATLPYTDSYKCHESMPVLSDN